YLLGFSLNNLSLMALTISTGFVVDDAIVVLENVSRHLEEGKSRLEAAIEGAKEVSFTVVSISLSLVAVFLPRQARKQHGRLYRLTEAGFDGMLAFYRITLDVALRHPWVTLAVFFST